jgi:hypothetical protein
MGEGGGTFIARRYPRFAILVCGLRFGLFLNICSCFLFREVLYYLINMLLPLVAYKFLHKR